MSEASWARSREEAIRLDPAYALPYQTRASLRVHAGKLDEAAKDADEAVRLDPANAQVYTTRAGVWAAAGDLPKALTDMSRAVRLSPGDAKLLVSRATCLRAAKAWGGVLNDLNEAVRLDPENAAAWSDRAWLRATCPDAKFRAGKSAVEDATRACRLSSWRDGNHLTALAAAYAESGEFGDAVSYARRALEFPAAGPDWADRARQRLRLYEGRQPYRTGE
ncbi:MAG: tetratricopeptide repeat protein [Gemmataceae bacterium]